MYTPFNLIFCHQGIGDVHLIFCVFFGYFSFELNPFVLSNVKEYGYYSYVSNAA